MKNREYIVFAVIILLVGVGAYMFGYHIANTHIEATLSASLKRAKDEQISSDKDKADSNTQKMYICFVHAQTKSQVDICYRSAIDDLLPPLTINDYNELPDVR